MGHFVRYNPGKEPAWIADEVKVLHRFALLVIDELKNEINHTDLEDKADIKNSIRYKVTPKKAIVYSEHDAFYLDQEIEPFTMVYARNQAIPIDLRILKDPTAKDIRQGVGFRTVHGRVRHPGREGLNFIDKAIATARERLVDEIIEGKI